MKMNLNRSAELNPFRVSQFEKLKWNNKSGSLDEIYQKLKENNFRGQITGKHGAGKSTLAQKLQRKAIDNGLECIYLFANESSRNAHFQNWEETLNKVSPETIVILDGIGHVSYFKRKRFLRMHSKLLLVLHKQLKQEKLICHLSPDSKLLEKLIQKLAGSESTVLLEKVGGAKPLLKKHNDNLRDCFFELYKIWQNLDSEKIRIHQSKLRD